MAIAPKKTTTDAPAAPEPVKVEIVTPEVSEPKLSAHTLAEQEAGRAALAAIAARK